MNESFLRSLRQAVPFNRPADMPALHPASEAQGQAAEAPGILRGAFDHRKKVAEEINL